MTWVFCFWRVFLFKCRASFCRLIILQGKCLAAGLSSQCWGSSVSGICYFHMFPKTAGASSHTSFQVRGPVCQVWSGMDSFPSRVLGGTSFCSFHVTNKTGFAEGILASSLTNVSTLARRNHGVSADETCRGRNSSEPKKWSRSFPGAKLKYNAGFQTRQEKNPKSKT